MSQNVQFVRQAAAELTGFLRDEDQIVVAPFRKGITAITGPTRDPATIADAIAAVKPQGGTAIVDALLQVSEGLEGAEGRRVVVLLTDGYDEHSRNTFEATIAALKTGQVTVYVVGIGGVAGVSLHGEQLLRRIAAETGGRVFFPWNARQLAEAHAAIAADVQHRYRLAYTPTNQQKDGTWRAITLSAIDAAYKVRARPGYTALQPPLVRAALEFTASDDTREYVDLAREDLDVIEDGVVQRVDVFHEAVAPVAIVLAIDASGSMTRAADIARQAAASFIEAVRPADRLALVQFADRAELVADLQTARGNAQAALVSYNPAGGTALYDALQLSMQSLRATEGRRAIVVVTDGRDENAASTGPGSEATWEMVIAAAHANDATIYAIGLGPRVERIRLQQLADLTGGEAYFADDLTNLNEEYRRVIDDLHRRYVLGYTSTNSNRDGTLADRRTAQSHRRGSPPQPWWLFCSSPMNRSRTRLCKTRQNGKRDRRVRVRLNESGRQAEEAGRRLADGSAVGSRRQRQGGRRCGAGLVGKQRPASGRGDLRSHAETRGIPGDSHASTENS